MELFYLLIIAGLVVIIFRAILRSKQPPLTKAPQCDDPATAALIRSIELRKSVPANVQTNEETAVAVFIDVETTGLSPRFDEVIEFAADLFAFNRQTGEVLGVIDSYC